MRVIAGSARRTPLVAPKGQNTRPTADRIKENLFNIIAPYVPGARVLDLFCGSGAIGIEALSRGAGEAVFVDSSRDAISALTVNLARARLIGRIMPLCIFAAILMLNGEGMGFDIIFLDPPYGQGLLSKTMDELGKSNLLIPDGILIAECQVDESEPESGPLILQDIRAYGNTRLMFYTFIRRNQ